MRNPDVFGWVAIPAGPARDPKWLAVKDVRFGPRPHPGAPITTLAHSVDAAINAELIYVDEPASTWRAPSEDANEGNCVDFALEKRAELIALDVDPDRMALLIVRDTLMGGAEHALLLVDAFGSGDFLVLDSRNSLTQPSSQVRDYQPVVAYGEATEWLYGRENVGQAAA